MSKRGENIYHRKDGRWEGQYKCEKTINGKAKYISIYGHSYSEVKRKLNEKKASIIDDVLPCKLTFGEMSKKWFESKRNTVKESSINTYETKLNKHILPVFGKMIYDSISSVDFESFIQKLTAENFSRSYISDIFFVIRSICLFAHKRLGVKNICESIDTPKRETPKKRRILNNTETSKLVSNLAYKSDMMSVGTLLALSTGMRIGELCALTWKNINLEEKYITVSQTVQRTYDGQSRKSHLRISAPKSRSSERIIPWPNFIIPILAKHKCDCNSYFLSGTAKIVEPRTMQFRLKKYFKKIICRQLIFIRFVIYLSRDALLRVQI